MILLTKDKKRFLLSFFISFAGFGSLFAGGVAFGEILPVFSDKELVQNSDIIIIGEQKDTITVKVSEVIKGTYPADTIVLEKLPEYSRYIINKENKVEKKLSSAEVLLFIDGRTVPYSLVPSGVIRFSAGDNDNVLFKYGVRGSKGNKYNLILESENITKQDFIRQIKHFVGLTKIEYELELTLRLKILDTSNRDSMRPFIDWARQKTRWDYKEGINALLIIAKDYSTDAYLDAVWALREIRDPSVSKPLMEYINSNIDEKVLFDHIRTVGAIGGPDVLPFLIRLSTYDEKQEKVNCGAIHGLRLLYTQLKKDSNEANTLVKSILPTNYSNIPVCMREALVSIANDETLKALQQYEENKKAEGNSILYNDATKMIQKLRGKMNSDKEYHEKMVLLKTQEW
jgi:hypothetical protein